MSLTLRLADGLDRGHRSKVHQLEIDVSGKEVVIRAFGREDLSLESWTTARKAELFESTFRRALRVEAD